MTNGLSTTVNLVSSFNLYSVYSFNLILYILFYFTIRVKGAVPLFIKNMPFNFPSFSICNVRNKDSIIQYKLLLIKFSLKGLKSATNMHAFSLSFVINI